jgi:fatty acid omega-hydroxylase
MQRKTAANIFSVKNFKDFTGSVFVDELALLEKRLAKAIDLKETVDFHDLFHRFTLDGFGKIGFGIELDCMSKDKVPFALAFDRCQSKIDVRFFNPLWRMEETFNIWKKIELKKDIKTIRDFALGIITSRKAETEEEMSQRNDLLTYFLKLRGENGEQLSDQILTDYVLNFIIAGINFTYECLDMYSQNWAI